MARIPFSRQFSNFRSWAWKSFILEMFKHIQTPGQKPQATCGSGQPQTESICVMSNSIKPTAEQKSSFWPYLSFCAETVWLCLFKSGYKSH